MAGAHHVANRARSVTGRTAEMPRLEFLERAGHVVRGVQYTAMGTLALGLHPVAGARRVRLLGSRP